MVPFVIQPGLSVTAFLAAASLVCTLGVNAQQYNIDTQSRR